MTISNKLIINEKRLRGFIDDFVQNNQDFLNRFIDIPQKKLSNDEKTALAIGWGIIIHLFKPNTHEDAFKLIGLCSSLTAALNGQDDAALALFYDQLNLANKKEDNTVH